MLQFFSLYLILCTGLLYNYQHRCVALLYFQIITQQSNQLRYFVTFNKLAISFFHQAIIILDSYFTP